LVAKHSASTLPVRSSNAITHHGLPSRLRLRVMPVSTPQMVTSVFFARPSRFVLSWLASSLTLSRYPSSGWPVTQNPSSSFSPASFSLSVQSGTLGNGTAWSSPESSASPKSPTCPLSLSR
jgi:hypothetical protein